MKYYVTSDVHGFYTPLRAILAKAGYFDDTEPHKLLIVGDLFDRGKEAVVLQSFILDLLERDEVILIRGNHEDLFEELVTVDHGMRYDHHLSNGTYSTALQLTGFDKRHAKISPLAFARAARETPYYTTILPAMIDYYETDSFVFTHGWISAHRQPGPFHPYRQLFLPPRDRVRLRHPAGYPAPRLYPVLGGAGHLHENGVYHAGRFSKPGDRRHQSPDPHRQRYADRPVWLRRSENL